MVSFNPNDVSPLEDIRLTSVTGEIFDSSRCRLKLRSNSIVHDQQSLISFDSIQTADRLLDKLDLSVEDELLLQQALEEEEEQRRLKLMENREEVSFKNPFGIRNNMNINSRAVKKPVVCIPASAFPSLRHSNNNTINMQNKRMGASAPVPHAIFNDLSSDKKLVNSKGDVVEDHISKFRYSYLVQEEGDDDDDEMISNSGSINVSTDAPDILPIEKYRTKLVQKNVYYDDSSSPTDSFPNLGSMTPNSVPAQSKQVPSPVKRSSQVFSTHTPTGSVSSFFPNQNHTSSSLDSGSVKKNLNYSQTESENNILSTPGTDKSIEHESPGGSQSPYVWNKGHKKKNSFSIKNLFKSPKGTATNQTSPKLRDESPTDPNMTMGTALSDPNPITVTPQPKQQTVLQNSASKKPPVQKIPHSYKLLIEPRPRIPIMLSAQTTPRSHRKTSSLPKNTDNLPVVKGQVKKAYGLPDPPKNSQLINNNAAQLQPSHNFQQTHRPPVPPKDNKQLQKMKKLPQEPVVNLQLKRAVEFKVNQKIMAALELRSKRQFADCTKLLREVCEFGDRTGFLLYGLALRHGSGIPVNLKESFKWIFKASGIKDEASEILALRIDPFKLGKLPHVSPEPEAPSLYECAIAYLKGYGFSRPNEFKGLKYLEKAASLGHIDSICLCGTIWSKKSKHRPRDSSRAAAWFRIADAMGADLIGAEWIYKEKYMRPSTENSRKPSKPELTSNPKVEKESFKE